MARSPISPKSDGDPCDVWNCWILICGLYVPSTAAESRFHEHEVSNWNEFWRVEKRFQDINEGIERTNARGDALTRLSDKQSHVTAWVAVTIVKFNADAVRLQTPH